MRSPPRYFAHADMPGAVLEDHDVAREKRPMGAAEVEQHAVMAGHRDHVQVGDDRSVAGVVLMFCVHENASLFAQDGGRVRHAGGVGAGQGLGEKHQDRGEDRGAGQPI